MEFRIPAPEVERRGNCSPSAVRKQRAALVVLLLNANRIVSRDRLIDSLWGECPPETAVTMLQGYVSNLRKALGKKAIVTQAPGYLVRVLPGTLTWSEFERLVAEAPELDALTAAGKLREALGLWRGLVLEDVTIPLVERERRRLEELRLAALEQRIQADLDLGRHVELVPELETLVRELPLRELLRGQLMLALYRSGRQADALDVYRSGRRLLAEELGLEPGEALKRLERSILEQDPALESPTGPRAPPAHARGHGHVPVR